MRLFLPRLGAGAADLGPWGEGEAVRALAGLSDEDRADMTFLASLPAEAQAEVARLAGLSPEAQAALARLHEFADEVDRLGRASPSPEADDDILCSTGDALPGGE